MGSTFWILISFAVCVGVALLAVVFRYAVTGTFDREIGVPLFTLAGTLVTAIAGMVNNRAKKEEDDDGSQP
ncbi:LPXTG cell wall anchor domain-containing protein [Deinococcus peraridilitoris]|uniref:Uncharacterized protein n=1 Tax=Deinococcus peraridilitoris (strain DSM 19664 / LMG 22246 / CIP 109416 / KR-200) TaxID=937777 RepID=L0A0S5_DEIPD|nr:LPXTG cell wall anchor domain-containing protein [Deinococcus peraridilitoris]AFZ67059.1 hypothetical protein Deipe_1518 [Deinococcus peraridilitoris DSM 19664]